MCWESGVSRKGGVDSDVETWFRKRSRGIGEWSQNILSVGKKRRRDQIVPGSCHTFLVVTIKISYWDFNRTAYCFCSSHRMSDALANFILLLFSFYLTMTKKQENKKTKTKNILSTWWVTYVFDLVFCQNRRSRGPAADCRLAVFSCSTQLTVCYGCFHSANLKPSNIPLAPA